MDYILEGFKEAVRLIISLDRDIFEIVILSLFLSSTATILGSLISIPFGIRFGIEDFKGKRLFSRITYTMMSIPTVVVGLLVHIILSRKGPFGSYGLMYTAKAMIIAQTLLVMPLSFGLSYGLSTNRGKDIEKVAMTLGANKFQSIILIIRELKLDIIVNIATSFSRAISEVGAVMIVGGNIKHHTRVITTTISMMNSMGDYPTAIALGIILLLISFFVHSIIYSYSKEN